MIVSVLGPSLFNLLLAIAIFSVPVYGRLAHALALVLRNMDYVEAARAVGGRTPRILLHHMLPNALPPLVVQATLTASTVVLSAASFSFLGLGVQPPTPERRAMMSGARELFGLDAALVHSTAPGRDGPKSQAAAR